MLICKDCGREVRKDDVCCPGCGSTDVVINNYVAEPFTPKSAFKSLFMNFNKFNGRSGRSEFWKAFLGNIVASFVFILFVAVVALVVVWPTLDIINNSQGKPMTELDVISLIFSGLCAIVAVCYVVIITIGWIAMYMRRMHDVGRPGALAFLSLVPIVGTIVLLVLSLADSKPEVNEYGTSPKIKLTV